jgi:TolB-like protein
LTQKFLSSVAQGNFYMKNMIKVFLVISLLIAYTDAFAQQQPVVAVAPFDAISGISATDANMITRVFFIRLGNTNKVTLVERGMVERVLQEHRFQTGDWSNTQKTAELGGALNADWIVKGELEKFGDNILVTIQFYDIRTFRFMGGADLRLASLDDAYEKMDPLVNRLIETISDTGVRPSVISTSNAPTNRTYNIGDTGPAGGLIFYNRGFIADGWQYLEAAPAGTEFTAQWGANGQNVTGTNTTIGSGRRNTQIIVNKLNQLGELGRASQICVGMDINGYKDWFIPSKDELNLMYKNLHQNGLGVFGGARYWSTSQYSHDAVWNQNFIDGIQYYTYKSNTYTVRAVRAF